MAVPLMVVRLMVEQVEQIQVLVVKVLIDSCLARTLAVLVVQDFVELIG
jgi:hypothetical protein